LEINEFLHERSDDILRFQDIKDGNIGDDKYTLLALSLAVVFVDIGRENEAFLRLKKALKFWFGFEM
jgi:Ribonuclease G/E